MPTFDLPRRLVAELLGTLILVATVVGSGIMAERLTHDVALALLGNTLPTGAILVVLITILRTDLGRTFQSCGLARVCAQARAIGRGGWDRLRNRASHRRHHRHCAGACDVCTAADRHLHERACRRSATSVGRRRRLVGSLSRSSPAFALQRRRCRGWSACTSRLHTGSPPRASFANPAVAIARSLTNTFSGIRPVDLPGFITAEFVGALIALALCSWLLQTQRATTR